MSLNFSLTLFFLNLPVFLYLLRESFSLGIGSVSAHGQSATASNELLMLAVFFHSQNSDIFF